MRRSSDAEEFFGLTYLHQQAVAGEGGEVTQRGTTNPRISPEAENAQKNNSTNKMRKARKAVQ